MPMKGKKKETVWGKEDGRSRHTGTKYSKKNKRKVPFSQKTTSATHDLVCLPLKKYDTFEGVQRRKKKWKRGYSTKDGQELAFYLNHKNRGGENTTINLRGGGWVGGPGKKARNKVFSKKTGDSHAKGGDQLTP